jgi:hypothetical protein
MEQFKGLSRDTTRSKTPAGMWEFARNILLTKGFTSVSNEYGFIEQVDIPGEVIGVISTNEETVILSIDGDFSCIGYFNNEELIYIPVIRSIYLGFKINHPIEGVFFYNFKQELIIAFCDGVALDSNTPKLINLNNLGFEVDVNYELVNPDDINLLNLFINTIEGNIRISYGTNSTIPIDIVYITFCYVLPDNISTTPYYPVHHIAYPTFQWNEKNRRPVIINLTELDNKYDQLKIGLIINTDNGLVGYESFPINYNNSQLNYTISSLTDFTITTLDNLIVPTIFYNRVKTMTTQNNQLVIGNIAIEEEIKIQKYVNRLELKLQYIIDEEEKFTHPTLCPDEVYAIYIQPQWLTGEFGKAYPLIGPEPNNNTERNILTQTDLNNLGLNELDANEYKKFHIINSGDWVLPPPFISNGDSSQVALKWGFWENEEVYPNIEDFNSTIDYNNNPLGGTDLRNTPIKYFRVPGLDNIIKKIPCPLGHTHKNDLNNSVTFQGYIPKFGVYLNNFNTVFPEKVREKMQGYRLLIVKRKQGNRLVEDIPFIHHGETRTMDIDGTNREFIHANYDNPQADGGQSLRHIYIQHGFSKLWSSTLSYYKNTISAKIIKANYGITHTRVRSGNDIEIELDDKGTFESVNSISNFTGYCKIKETQKYGIIKDLIYVPGNNIAAKTQFLEEGIFLKAKNYLQTDDGGYTDLPDEKWNPLLIYSPNGLSSRIDNIELYNSTTRLYEDFDITESDGCYKKTLSVTLLNLQKNLYSGFNPKEFISLGRVNINESNKILSDNGDIFTNNIIRVPTGILLGTSIFGRIIYNDLYIKGIWNINNNSSVFIEKDRPYNRIYELDGDGSESGLVNTFEFNLSFFNEDVFRSLNDLIVAIANNSLKPFINYFPFRVARTPKIPNENLQTNVLRTFRANDYYEMLNDRGEIIAIRGTNKQLFIQQKYSLFVATLKDKLNTDGTSTYLGEGDIFDRTPDEIKFNTNKGYIGCTNQFACIICPSGYVVVDQIKGKIFLIGDEYTEISKANMINWFEANWDTKFYYILDRFSKKQRVDNPFNSIGHLVGYDEDNNRLLFTKKYYEFKFPELVENDEEVGPFTYTFDGEFYYNKTSLVNGIQVNVNNQPSNGNTTSLNYRDINNVQLFNVSCIFVNTVTDPNHVLIGINRFATFVNYISYINLKLSEANLIEGKDYYLTISNNGVDTPYFILTIFNNTVLVSNDNNVTGFTFNYPVIEIPFPKRLIYNDERYFINKSKTLSFQLDDKVWVCEHDYYPNAYYFNQLGLFSIYNNPTFELDEEGAVININFNFSNYIHNQKSVNRGLFYNKNYQSYIDLIFNGRLDLSKLYQAVTWESVVYTIEQARLYNNTIDAIMIYSDYQCSGVINLEQFVNCRNVEGVWNFNEFRDVVINSNFPIVDSVGDLVENNVNFNKSFFDKSKFIGTFVVIRLIMFNNNTNDVYINQVNVKSRISKR